jgi:hypothetical protein
MDAEVRGKILCLCRGSNPGRPVQSQFLFTFGPVWRQVLFVPLGTKVRVATAAADDVSQDYWKRPAGGLNFSNKLPYVADTCSFRSLMWQDTLIGFCQWHLLVPFAAFQSTATICDELQLSSHFQTAEARFVWCSGHVFTAGGPRKQNSRGQTKWWFGTVGFSSGSGASSKGNVSVCGYWHLLT